MAHYVRMTANDDAETLRYRERVGVVTAEIKKRQHVATLLGDILGGTGGQERNDIDVAPTGGEGGEGSSEEAGAAASG